MCVCVCHASAGLRRGSVWSFTSRHIVSAVGKRCWIYLKIWSVTLRLLFCGASEKSESHSLHICAPSVKSKATRYFWRHTLPLYVDAQVGTWCTHGRKKLLFLRDDNASVCKFIQFVYSFIEIKTVSLLAFFWQYEHRYHKDCLPDWHNVHSGIPTGDVAGKRSVGTPILSVTSQAGWLSPSSC